MNVVERPALWQKLNEAMARPVILVSAPAGYGKTTLLRQWQQQAQWPIAWVCLDSHSRGVRQALTRLESALQTVLPGPAARGMVAESDEAVSDDAVVRLLNSIADLAHDVALVFDNHLPSPELIERLLGNVLDYLPPHLHIVIASRSVADLPLGRLRMRGQLAEIGAADLAFTVEEARLLAGTAAADLQARTEGWVTGLRLGLEGDDGALASYFEREVFAPQPAAMQRFLRQTCRLDVLTAQACNVASGGQDGQEMLEYLERENLFMVALDQERKGYRYHRMLAQWLQLQSLS